MWPGLALPMFLIYLSGRHGLSPAGQKRHFSRNFIVTFKKLILFSQPSCRVAQAFQWLSWNGIFSICAFPCAAVGLWALWSCRVSMHCLWTTVILTHPDAPLTLAWIYHLGKRLKNQSLLLKVSIQHLCFILYVSAALSSLYPYWSRLCFILKLSSSTTAFSCVSQFIAVGVF